MSWKNVFNSSHKRWGFITKANDAARDCGYKFFTWNGQVFAVDGESTGILVEELF